MQQAKKERPKDICPECGRFGRIVRGVCSTCYARYRKQGRLEELALRNLPSDRPCSVPGCGKPVGREGAKGMCFTHYQRLKTTGSLAETARTMPDEDRFELYRSPAGSCKCGCACERWTGGLNKSGYGHFYLDGKTQLAHRVAWTIIHGSVLDGMFIDHVLEQGCVHTDCVRLDHLEEVTPEQNAQRARHNKEAQSRGGVKGGTNRDLGLRERFLLKVNPEPCPCGCSCKRWIGSIHPKTGYGNIRAHDRTDLAHRVAWELANGRPVPEGLVIDHVAERGCVHRDCVHPGHLEAVTRKENAKRARRLPGRLPSVAYQELPEWAVQVH